MSAHNKCPCCNIEQCNADSKLRSLRMQVEQLQQHNSSQRKTVFAGLDRIAEIIGFNDLNDDAGLVSSIENHIINMNHRILELETRISEHEADQRIIGSILRRCLTEDSLALSTVASLRIRELSARTGETEMLRVRLADCERGLRACYRAAFGDGDTKEAMAFFTEHPELEPKEST